MVSLKNSSEIKLMQKAGEISARALEVAKDVIKAGVSTAYIDKAIYDYIKSQNAKPSFLGYGGFPATACISINNEVIHGIPSKERIVKEGDIVSVDVGAYCGGFHGDNAATFMVGEVSEEAKMLVEATRGSLEAGVKMAVAGNRIGDISCAVQEHVEQRGLFVVKKFVGHGIGKALHEDPNVPNYGTKGRGLRLVPGMTIAIEPMINIGSSDVKVLSDGWTVVTTNQQLSAHFEYTVLITNNEPVILTPWRI